MSPSKILFQLTGSIACYKACHVISRLVQDGHQVQVIATPSALQFVGRSTFEGLTGRPVLTELFEPGHAMDHIEWARWADIAILCPATAHTINKLAAGLADDLIGTLFLAYERHKPYLIAPAMNSEMFAHPKVRESLETLKKWQVEILPTDSGRLACGEIGPGKLWDPDLILENIRSRLENRLSRGRILITSGATREPIDGVRFITNMSTGVTGALMADRFSAMGFSVTYLHGEGAKMPSDPGIQCIGFKAFGDLDRKLKGLLEQEDFTAVVQAAAVSDYSVSAIDNGFDLLGPQNDLKLNSENELTLHLKRNFKIVDRLKSYSRNPQIKVIAFKLTHTENVDEQVDAVEKLLASPHIDMVVQNNLNEVSAEKSGERLHRFRVFKRNKDPMVCDGKDAMIDNLGAEL